MTESQHTPGPWRVVPTPEELYPYKIDAADGNSSQPWQIAHLVGGIGEKIDTANAHLIATAPETAAERDYLQEVNRQLVTALNLAILYLGKAVADDLMSDCVRPPAFALRKAVKAVAEAKKPT